VKIATENFISRTERWSRLRSESNAWSPALWHLSNAAVVIQKNRSDRHRQYSRKPLRCHWITVAGFTSTMAFKARGQIRQSHIQSSRSVEKSRSRPGRCRRSKAT